jgi:hypothetical protein
VVEADAVMLVAEVVVDDGDTAELEGGIQL